MRTRSIAGAVALLAMTLVGCSNRAVPPASEAATSVQSPTATATGGPSKASAEPAAPPSAVPLVLFQSPIFGYDAMVPEDWVFQAGTNSPTLADLASGEAFFDHFRYAGALVPEILATSTVRSEDMSLDAWIAAYRAPVVAAYGERCFPARDVWADTTVDGNAGWVYSGCNYVETMVPVGRRVYLFTLALPLGQEPRKDDPYILLTLLQRVTLHPERAVG